MRNLILFVIVMLITGTSISYSQESEKNTFTRAEQFVEADQFVEAIPLYQELIILYPENANMHFKLGFCYLNTILDKHKAIDYIEKAVEQVSDESMSDDFYETEAPVESFFYLGKAYRFNYQFKEAIDTLNYLIKTYLTENDKNFLEMIYREIQICKNGQELTGKSINITVTNLGNNINTQYSEHSPVFSADESVLIFTSKREGTTGGMMTDDGQFYEDIYISNKNEGIWMPAQSIGGMINSPGHEATIALSADGQQLFIFKDEDGDGNIFYSQLEGEKWSAPVKMPDGINTNYRETHASLSANGKDLYFTSNRPGGFGELDIYVVHLLPDGQWSKPQNLGPKINTKYNEEGPFIHPDGITLFFSSEGHYSMGGYDIFYSEVDNENRTCSEPVNMGYPINTTEDDVFYVPTPDGNRAYYGTYNTSGYGNYDIYLITLNDQKERSLVVMTGIVAMADTSKIINTEITVTDIEMQDEVGIYRTNSKTGKYLFILPSGNKYEVTYQAQGYIPHKEEIYISPDNTYQKIMKSVQLDTVFLNVFRKKKDAQGKDIYVVLDTAKTQDNDYYIDDVPDDKIVPCNILFDFDKDIPNQKHPELDTLAEYLIQNPGVLIEIGGHTDSKGQDIYNLHLSLRRAQFVGDYLMKKGVKKECLIIKGYGEKYPIALNTRSDSSDYKESQNYNRRVDFSVIRQGNPKLFFKRIKVPDQFRIKSIPKM